MNKYRKKVFKFYCVGFCPSFDFMVLCPVVFCTVGTCPGFFSYCGILSYDIFPGYQNIIYIIIIVVIVGSAYKLILWCCMPTPFGYFLSHGKIHNY